MHYIRKDDAMKPIEKDQDLAVLLEGEKRPALLQHGAWLMSEGKPYAKASCREGKWSLSDLTGRGLRQKGGAHRRLKLQSGDTFHFLSASPKAPTRYRMGIVVNKLFLPEASPTTERDAIAWGPFLGASKKAYTSFIELATLGNSAAPVWLEGESGTGKELAARALHDASPFADGPFEVINCAALPKELAEAELFGVEKGAYTGASRSRLGAFQRAHHGTLFLDEIGELPLPLQSKLLRAVDYGEVQALGSAHKRRVNVRLISASWRDIEALVAAHNFRHDLYHRLCVLKCELPPLRERPDDLLPLLYAYLQNPKWGHWLENTRGLWPDHALWDVLKAQFWGGNVREFRNRITRVLATQDPAFYLDDGPALHVHDKMGRKEMVAAVEALYQGNKTKMAHALGVSRSTLYRWQSREQAQLEGLGLRIRA